MAEKKNKKTNFAALRDEVEAEAKKSKRALKDEESDEESEDEESDDAEDSDDEDEDEAPAKKSKRLSKIRTSKAAPTESSSEIRTLIDALQGLLPENVTVSVTGTVSTRAK